MHITKVTSSKTYQLYCTLIEAGFNAEINSMFSYDYDKDNTYLSIFVRDAEFRLNKLYDIANEFDILLVKHAKENNACFQIRKSNQFGEFVTEPVWREYFNSLTVLSQKP